MSTLISPLKLAVSSAIFGLTLFNLKPVASQTFFQTTINSRQGTGADNYSDPTNTGVNYGTSRFIQVGSAYDPADINDPNDPFANPPFVDPNFPLVLEEVAHIRWDLSNIISDIKNNHPGTFLGNVDAFVSLTHTKSDQNNLNDFDEMGVARPGGRNAPTVLRINNINAYEVTGSWNENTAINTNALPTRNNPLLPGNPVLFEGNVQFNLDPNSPNRVNNYQGSGLNQLVKIILDNNLDDNPSNNDPTLSIALEATDIFDFPDLNANVFAVESFFSQNDNDESLRPKITVRYELLDEGTKVEGGPNFKAQTRGGASGAGDWEIGVFPTNDQGDDFDQLREENWVWTNDELVDFELVCDPDNGNVNLTLSNGNITSTTPDFTNVPCEKIDGLKIFATARTSEAEIEYNITEFTDLNDNIIPIPDLSVFPQQLGANGDEDFFAFPGIIGEQLGAKNIKGTVKMSWGPGGAPQNPRSGSLNQTFLIPLTRIPNTSPLPEESFPDVNERTPQEIQQERLEQLESASSVPEPNSIAALIFLATTGSTLKLLGRKQDQN
ncbi:hypothetical protein [Crocosphaera sp. Alani8]|uniref:hypothetical protein n=1 Tax=Crocosphaera sp. Alani8 TaxID=3038952 RepID=UPI00313D0672